MNEALNRGGPDKCPTPCVECDDSHHWMDVSPDPSDAEDENATHPAYKEHGLLAWNACKHCDAWEEIEEYDSGDLG